MMRRLLVLLSLLVLAAVQPAHSAPLKLGVLPAADTIVLHVAADEGLFAKQGLEVELVPFQSALELGAAMRAGAAERAFQGTSSTSSCRMKAARRKLLWRRPRTPRRTTAVSGSSSPPSPKRKLWPTSKGRTLRFPSATIIDFLLAQLLLQEGAAPDFLNRQVSARSRYASRCS